MLKALVLGSPFEQTSLGARDFKLYIFTALFVAGNLVFPAIVHSVPMGGLIFLPIYFFTLIAGYRFGLVAGLATAFLSPVLNNLLTGMPPVIMLDRILVKSVFLAVAAFLIARHSAKVSLLHLFLVILAYQIAGGLYETIRAGSILAALGDFKLGWPGLVIQLVLGYAVLRVWGGHADKTSD